MAENEQVQGESQEQGQEANTTAPSYDDMMAQVRAEVKNELDGLNRKIGELSKEKREAEEAARIEAESKMTVSQRLERIESDLKASREEAELERHKTAMTKVAITELEKAGLPSNVIAKMDITTEESIAKDIDLFKSLFEATEKTAKDELRKKHSFKPSGSEKPRPVPKTWAECKTPQEKAAYLEAKRG